MIPGNIDILQAFILQDTGLIAIPPSTRITIVLKLYSITQTFFAFPSNLHKSLPERLHATATSDRSNRINASGLQEYLKNIRKTVLMFVKFAGLLATIRHVKKLFC